MCDHHSPVHTPNRRKTSAVRCELRITVSVNKRWDDSVSFWCFKTAFCSAVMETLSSAFRTFLSAVQPPSYGYICKCGMSSFRAAHKVPVFSPPLCGSVFLFPAVGWTGPAGSAAAQTPALMLLYSVFCLESILCLESMLFLLSSFHLCFLVCSALPTSLPAFEQSQLAWGC